MIEYEDGKQPQLNKNEDIATMMANMQARLEAHARMIEQQVVLIQNLQQQQVGLGNLKNGHGQEGPGVVQQPPLVKSEPLCERFCKMKPVEFQGSTNPLDAEEWISSIQIIMEFMELNDQERVICASYMLKREAHYWWEIVKARRTVRMT